MSTKADEDTIAAVFLVIGIIMGATLGVLVFKNAHHEQGEFCAHAQVWYGEAEDTFYREVPQCRWILK